MDRNQDHEEEDGAPPTYGQIRRMADVHASSMHDRARPELRAAILQWDAASGYLSPGDRFVVSNPNHRCADVAGTVEAIQDGENYMVKLDEIVNGRRIGPMHRSDMKRLDFSHDSSYVMTRARMRMMEARDLVMDEMELEMIRLIEIEQNQSLSTVKLDVNGNEVFVGDMVYVAPEEGMEHPFKDWLCQVQRVKVTGELVLRLGMPPRRLRRPSRQEIYLRRERPGLPLFHIRSERVRVINMALDES